jgi:hypothetical protein
MKRVLALSSLTAAAAIAVACSSNKPNPPVTPLSPIDAGSEAGAVTAPPPDAGVGAADAGSGPAMPTFFTDAGSGTPTAPAMTDQAMDIAIDALLAAAATKNAPKMAEEGQPGHTTMKENDHWAMMINMQPNRCYTIIATALPGTIAQLDLHLYGPPFYNVEAGKSGAQDKALPIIGKGTAALCPVLPLAVPYKLDVVATKGAGRMGVKVYSRSK